MTRTEVVHEGGPLAGMPADAGSLVAYRDGQGARVPAATGDRAARPFYGLTDRGGRPTPNGRNIVILKAYVWRPARVAPPAGRVVTIACPQCGEMTAQRIRGSTDFACRSKRCSWFDLACRGCGLMPRATRGIALCGSCLAGEFRHLASEDEVPPL